MAIDIIEKSADSGGENRRLRSCLRCSTSFESAWAGERVCQRCKGSSTWRNGSGMEVRRTQSRSTPSGRS
jgi:uncharacterized paraquat-inducible protein A